MKKSQIQGGRCTVGKDRESVNFMAYLMFNQSAV